MKVTFILPKYPQKPAGGFKVVYEYANYLVLKGHQVTIIHPERLLTQPLPNGAVQKFKRIGQIIKNAIFKPRIPTKLEWQFVDPKVDMRYVPNLNEKFIPCSNCIVATAWHTADYVNKYNVDKGSKFYFIQHFETWDGPEDRVINTWMYPMNKIVIAKWLMNIGRDLGATNIVHIPNAIDHNIFKKKVDIKLRKNTVAMLYHESKWKGSEIGIQALEIAKREIPDLRVILFGVPSRGNNIPEWMGYIQRPDLDQLVNEIYNNSSIYLCPSYKEGWGLPSAESLACGCALVSTRNGGVEDFAQHEKTALLSRPGDIQELATNLLKLLRDDKKRIILAEAGYNEIQNYSYKRSGEKFEHFLYENMKN